MRGAIDRRATNDLADFHRAISLVLVPLLWIHVPLVAGVAWLLGNAWVTPSIMAAVVAGFATVAWLRVPIGKSTRLTIAVALIAMVSLVLAVCQGTSWQNDLHMYYYAALAILAVYCDRDVVLTGAAVTALHHLGLNFLAPALVFPGGAQLGRVALHAGVVILETSALVWMTTSIATLITVANRNLALMTAASDAARSMEEAAGLEQRAQVAVVTAIGEGLERLASGDLAIRLVQPFASGYETLRKNFNIAVTQLHTMVEGIVHNTASLQSSTNEINAAATDLSRRTEQQALNLEQTAASLNQITAAVQVTAESADQARNVVSQTKDDAKRSGCVVQQAVTAMGRIDESSRQIGQIVRAIDEIAFQTNLLALNAGVEAARAGEAGLGFAVVATEVRDLAKRSAKAAKEIKALISAASKHVGLGVQLVTETGDMLGRIVDQIDDLDSVVGAIAASAGEQASGLAEVNRTINQMDQVTQNNAAMVEQSTVTIHALAQEAEELGRLTGRFDLGQARTGHSPAPRRIGAQNRSGDTMRRLAS